jgi:cysteine desulfurase
MTTIYADNAATTQMSRAAIDAMLPYLETIYGNPSSLHSVGQQAAGALLSARDRIAKCLNASPREIYFTSGGSEADNQAILSAARLGERKGKKHIISTAFEHHAVLHTLQKLEKEGFTVELLPVGPIGTVTAQQVKRAIREDTCLVSVMYANNEIGSILPISAIGAVCRAAGVLFHTDAVQAAGHLPIDVKAQNIDLLSLSAHKFHGPKGTGVLYARQGVFLTNLIEGGEGESLLLLLDAKGICASSGSACTSGSLDPSHVLLAIGRPHDVAHSSLRLSLCEWNTDEEIDRILDAVPEVVEYLRGMSPLWKDLVSGKKPFTL